jgi:hypothetical protein
VETLRPHENLVLQTLLTGEHPLLAQLREQAADVSVVRRTYTTVGEYVDLEVASHHVAIDPPNIIFDDIDIEVEGVKHGVATLLYILDGKLNFLDFATLADTWPENPVVTGVKYFRSVETAPGCYALEPASERDSATLQRSLIGRSPKSAA